MQTTALLLSPEPPRREGEIAASDRLSCAFMNAGSQMGSSAAAAGATTARFGAGGTTIGKVKGWALLGEASSAFTVASASYGLIGMGYAYFGNGAKYLGGCRAYGF